LTTQDIDQFIYAVKNVSEFDFSEYTRKSFKRRLEKVLIDNNMNLQTLIKRLQNDREFLVKIINAITVNTTELFRDPKMWQSLRYQVLPELQNKKYINIWHAGCAGGQEVYSMLILLNEVGLFDKTKILATDINSEALKVARTGIYKYRFNIGYLDNFEKVINENPYNYDENYNVPYEKYFNINKDNDTIQMNQFLIEKPFFRKHNLAVDGEIPFAKFDIIICRNVIIYFNYDLQNKAFQLFYNSLFDKGYLFLGAHESILGPFSSKFKRKKFFYIKDENL